MSPPDMFVTRALLFGESDILQLVQGISNDGIQGTGWNVHRSVDGYVCQHVLCLPIDDSVRR